MRPLALALVLCWPALALADTQYRLTQEPVVYCDHAGQYFITGTACPADSKEITEDDFNLQGPGGDINGKFDHPRTSVNTVPRPPSTSVSNYEQAVADARILAKLRHRAYSIVRIEDDVWVISTKVPADRAANAFAVRP
jgi:hypothetical protein